MANSYNGWPADPDPAAIGVVKSQWFPGGVKAGDVTTVLRYVAEQFDARVEPIVGGWCWGYTYKANVNNPSSLSCHASGTALDINAPDHPNGSGGTFTSAQRGVIYSILDEVSGAVSWLEGYDEMHFEIQVDAAALASIAAQLPAGGGPPPVTLDDLGEDMYQLVRNEDDGSLWAAAPGHFQYLSTGEQVTVAQDCGLLTTTEKVTNNRGLDVLKDVCLTADYADLPSAVVPN